MTSDEIRRRYLDFFAEQDHRILPSAPLIPAEHDPSVLFTVAGMVPFKPYFLGRERPPHPRVTTCQKTFRTVDIEIIGTTTRHLTLFEMLGNFSFGDYFKAGAIRYAWELSRDGFGFDPDQIWITVFAGDDGLGIGPDQEAIDAWLEVGVPRERIVECGRSENFWQMGPTGPCGPCSELYLDRGLEFGRPEDLPGGENERFLEYWNLVFMQYDQNPPGQLTPLPAQSIDTGLGLNRLAAILQDKETVFETDQFAPLIALGEELSGRRYGSDLATDRALRILADHSRAMAFLIGDGVVPSNEDRGYVLRRVIRRAILQGSHTLGLEPGFLGRYADRVIELMGGHYRELVAQRDLIERWLAAEEEGFGRTLAQGSKLLDELIDRARESGAEGISGADAFRLHDTYGFPIDLTLELVAEHELGVDEAGFEVLMDEQRTRARAGAGRGRASGELRELAIAFAGETPVQTEFVGYEAVERETTVAALATEGDGLLLKLEQSPFYATGGGQVADAGWVECLEGDCRGRVTDVVRLGDDQVLAVVPERGVLEPGERVRARVDRAARHATECNHTATHLLHAALRAHLGDHVHQAGSYVGPDKLRFDFTHGSGLSAEALETIEDAVNRWVLESHAVRAVTTTLDEARRLGAMALFGEKYGDVVRIVEVGDGSFSRELCGGTHVRTTSEIGLFTVLNESSSAANVRRIEAVTGPEAVDRARAQSAQLAATARELRVPVERVAEAAHELRARARALEKAGRDGARAGVDLDALLAAASEIEGASVLIAPVTGAGDGKALMALADQLRARLGDSAVVVGSPGEGRVDVVAAVAPALAATRTRSPARTPRATSAVGGGGGGRDTIARAGGRDPDGLPEALRVASEAIETALRASR